MLLHDVPYAQPSPACPCPTQPCGGLVINPDCPDHGHRKEPAMERHIADSVRCRELTTMKESA